MQKKTHTPTTAAASSSSESPTTNTFRMGNKNTHNCRTPGTREKNTTTHSQLLPPVLNLQLQIHSECQKKKKTSTTAELQGQVKKHNNTLPAASSSSESPTATTFRMQKKNTHNCRNPTTRTSEKTQHKFPAAV
jgi:hypothetical protein